MTKRRVSKPSDYVVGYRRPPRANQFAPGKSGNPQGRPKGTRTVAAMINAIVRQKITVTENGRARRLPAIEVALRRLCNDAMRSDPRAMKLLLSLVDRYADSPEAAPRTADVEAEDRAILEQYLHGGDDGGLFGSRSSTGDRSDRDHREPGDNSAGAPFHDV